MIRLIWFFFFSLLHFSSSENHERKKKKKCSMMWFRTRSHFQILEFPQDWKPWTLITAFPLSDPATDIRVKVLETIWQFDADSLFPFYTLLSLWPLHFQVLVSMSFPCLTDCNIQVFWTFRVGMLPLYFLTVTL